MSLESSMMEIEKIISSPISTLRKYHQLGKKVFGVLPYHFPEEILYAMDIIPMGLWGANVKLEKAKEYFPSFFCGMLQTELEMILSHRLDELDGIVLNGLCDSLKAFSLNVIEAKKDMKFYILPQSLNRKSSHAFSYMEKKCMDLINEIKETQNVNLDEDRLAEAIQIYNENRILLEEFSSLAATHMKTITPKMRSHVFKAGHLMDRKEHNALIHDINDSLRSLPVEKFHGMKVITCGIMMDNDEILDCMEKYHIGIAHDMVDMESMGLSVCNEHSLQGLIHRYLDIQGISFLDNSKMERIDGLLNLLNVRKADGVIYFMTKFCDPEEYDYPILRDRLEEEGYPCVLIETDKSVMNSGQSETILEAFSEN